MQLGKFDSDRDEILWQMTLDGWANDSGGDVESPTGWFAIVCNAPAEMPGVTDAFSDVIPEGFDTSSLIGNFIIRENSQGFVSVETFETQREAIAQFEALDAAFVDWECS